MLDLGKIRFKKLKWGIAGLGHYSENTIIPTLSTVRKARIMSVYSSTPERAKFINEKFDIPHAFSDFGQFLTSDIDAVYIGSANCDHYEQVLQAAAAKKHILCDKPLALTSRQAREMVQTCKDNNVQLAVNYVYRFHPLAAKVKELITNQAIGNLIHVNAHFNINFPPDNNFRFIKSKSGGGAMRDLGSHLLDLFRYFGGEMEPVSCIMDNVIFKSEVEDFASGTLKFENGGYASFLVSTNTGKAFNRIEIIGSDGSICLENLIGQKQASAKLTILLEKEAKMAFRKRANKVQRGLKLVTGAFLKNKPALATGEDGLIGLELIEKLEKLAGRK
jgi:predicted dehydrogenase